MVSHSFPRFAIVYWNINSNYAATTTTPSNTSNTNILDTHFLYNFLHKEGCLHLLVQLCNWVLAPRQQMWPNKLFKQQLPIWVVINLITGCSWIDWILLTSVSSSRTVMFGANPWFKKFQCSLNSCTYKKHDRINKFILITKIFVLINTFICCTTLPVSFCLFRWSLDTFYPLNVTYSNCARYDNSHRPVILRTVSFFTTDWQHLPAVFWLQQIIIHFISVYKLYNRENSMDNVREKNIPVWAEGLFYRYWCLCTCIYENQNFDFLTGTKKYKYTCTPSTPTNWTWCTPTECAISGVSKPEYLMSSLLDEIDTIWLVTWEYHVTGCHQT